MGIKMHVGLVVGWGQPDLTKNSGLEIRRGPSSGLASNQYPLGPLEGPRPCAGLRLLFRKMKRLEKQMSQDPFRTVLGHPSSSRGDSASLQHFPPPPGATWSPRQFPQLTGHFGSQVWNVPWTQEKALITFLSALCCHLRWKINQRGHLGFLWSQADVALC